VSDKELSEINIHRVRRLKVQLHWKPFDCKGMTVN
jgi:hypothetical protein